jgi:hypothetical protein
LFSEKYVLQDTYPEKGENTPKERRKRIAKDVFSEVRKQRKWRKPTFLRNWTEAPPQGRPRLTREPT